MNAYQDRWVNHDPGDPPHHLSSLELAEFIQSNHHLKAMSSHMLVPPVPKCDVEIFPMVFIREPITRVMSAYLFEWKKQKNTAEPIGPLSDYIATKFAHPRCNAIEEFQCLRLGNKDPSRRSPDLNRSDFDILQDAKDFLFELPTFGIVDRFDESLERFDENYGDLFPEISFENVALNTTQSTSLSLDERYEKIRNEIGVELFSELLARNQLDIQLYHYSCGLFDATRHRGSSQRQNATK